jgi:hypothetical protein
VNVRIGMTYTPKELELELEDGVSEEIVDEITKAVASESAMLWLTDRKGRRVGIATTKLAWVEVGPESEGRRVGFSAL